MYDLPPQVLRAISMLNAAGHRAYVVGGAVRELLRGKGTVTDFDLTTSARPEETEGVFAGFRLIETGLKHGTVTVLLDGLPLEITTFRVDGTYSDGRLNSQHKYSLRIILNVFMVKLLSLIG